MLSLVSSTIAFFVARYYLRRWAQDNDFPKGMTLSISIIVFAIAIAYGVAVLVDQLAALAGG